MSFVPEDRLGMGFVASMGMVDNMLPEILHGGERPLCGTKACQGAGAEAGGEAGNRDSRSGYAGPPDVGRQRPEGASGA